MKGILKSADCPDEAKLNDYLGAVLGNDEIERLEKHFAECDWCLNQLCIACEAKAAYEKSLGEPIDTAMLERAKAIVRAKATSAGAKRKAGAIWLTATIASFILSFVFPRYFMQFLVATILFGIKWIAESENVRLLIMVIDAWRRGRPAYRSGRRDKEQEISQRIKERL